MASRELGELRIGRGHQQRGRSGRGEEGSRLPRIPAGGAHQVSFAVGQHLQQLRPAALAFRGEEPARPREDAEDMIGLPDVEAATGELRQEDLTHVLVAAPSRVRGERSGDVLDRASHRAVGESLLGRVVERGGDGRQRT